MVYPHRLTDPFGRRVNYLRISLTDRCNFRCLYCMPEEGLPVLPAHDILTGTQIVRLVQIMSRLGIERVRLTGGEPLLREDILDIVRGIKEIGRIKDLSLTTNGSRLSTFVKPLKQAGLDRINISLDSLEAVSFRKVTRTHDDEAVLRSIMGALEEAFPLKLNMVVLKGVNDHEILNFVSLAFDYPLEIRFLEFMPLCGSNWQKNLFMPMAQVRSLVKEKYDLAEDFQRGDNVAQTFHIRNGKGKLGFIASLTEPFCDRCSRLRLTSDGKIRPCLFSHEEVSLKELLKENRPDEEIIAAVLHAVKIKPRGNPLFYDQPFQDRDGVPLALDEMPYIRSIGG
ncbi:MAG: GTP 3',8-cyclase MoaA [Chlamydiae bacterium]|nr:GTP 3',8-cyclase MoaA [Chlamydiota bacterium]